jgi:hypothetical protein
MCRFLERLLTDVADQYDLIKMSNHYQAIHFYENLFIKLLMIVR